MNILWITNVELPLAASFFGREIFVGGWMDNTSVLLSKTDDINLYIVSDAKNYCYENQVIENIHFWGFDADDRCKMINDAILVSKPDVVHIWGTEGCHIKDAISVLRRHKLLDRTVISIQGLTSECYKYYCAGLPSKVSRKLVRIGRIKRTSLKNEMKEMKKHGAVEKAAIRSVKHCIGRTDWDYKCVKKINPAIQYHHVDEILRQPFYEASWTYENCKKNSIFFSQSHYPLKGLHYMLEALALVKIEIPDVELRVLGINPKEVKDGRLRSYSDYLVELIDKNHLESNIVWLGSLSADEMVNEYLAANVFVCASAIENSSNSVCEAMLVGTPIVATDVGGMRSLFGNNCDMLVGFGDTYILSRHILDILGDSNSVESICELRKKNTMKRHQAGDIIIEMLSVYKDIANNENKI